MSSVCQILMHHIKATLPDIKSKISQNLLKFEQELATLGGAAGEQNSVRSLPTHPPSLS